MQRLQSSGEVDIVAEYLAADRPAVAGRPWVVVGMVTSLDGATALDDRSGGLGGDADRAAFRAVRAIADAIVVGAGTARAENYRLPQRRDNAAAARAARGVDPGDPRLVVVSRSLDLPRRAFEREGAALAVTSAGAGHERVDELRRSGVEIRIHGDDEVDLEEMLRHLHADGVDVVVVEGGPTLNGALLDADLVDEVCLTIAPALVGGSSSRMIAGADEGLRNFTLSSLLHDGGVLCGRWLRDRSTPAAPDPG